MAKDPAAAQRVAWTAAALLLAGCPPTVMPPRPPPDPGPVGRVQPRGKPVAHGRQVVLGELCPAIAQGRPAIAPLMMRTMAWSDAPADLANMVERGAVPRFAVLGKDGRPAGVFDTIGLADIGLRQSVASGTYTGSGPCTTDTGPNPRTDDPACVAATGGCGIAIAEVSRPDDMAETPTFQAGAACVAGDSLLVDVDGDGTPESYPLSAALDGVRAPAAEWVAQPKLDARTCTPMFALYGVPLAPAPEPGKPADPKAVVAMDVLGVLDLDGDGRKDLVLAFHFATVRTIVVFTAPETGQRYELAGEAQSFAK